jgi:hypothetical protein
LFFVMKGNTMNWARDFDWDLAVKHNSEALSGIIAALFTMLDVTVSRIPKSLHSAVLQVLRPAESAVRRLIVIAARGLVVKVTPSRPMPKRTIIGKGGSGSRLPAFKLYDTRKFFPELSQRRVKYAKNPPRIHFLPTIPCNQRPGPHLLPFPRPMASSMPNASAAGSRPSSPPLRICRAKPGAWPAGG